jgi:hypothetical protein
MTAFSPKAIPFIFKHGVWQIASYQFDDILYCALGSSRAGRIVAANDLCME